MRRVASHWLYLPDGEKMHLPVVEITDNRVANYYPIESELPVTEWLGGVLVLSTMSEVCLSEHESFESILNKLHPNSGVRYPLYCWFIDNIDFGTESLTSFSKIELLQEED